MPEFRCIVTEGMIEICLMISCLCCFDGTYFGLDGVNYFDEIEK